jgi:hypothetical protein
VWIGRLPHRGELATAGFDAVVDMTCELSIDTSELPYTNVAVLDLTLPDTTTIEAAIQAIEWRRSAGRVLVCCALAIRAARPQRPRGWSRRGARRMRQPQPREFEALDLRSCCPMRISRR